MEPNAESGLAARQSDQIPLPFRPAAPRVERRPDGAILVSQDIPLCPREASLAHLFVRRAQEVPDRVLIAEKAGGETGGPEPATGAWRTETYGGMLDRARRIAAVLGDLGLARGDRLLVLAGESIDHLALSFGAMLAGVLTVPLSVGYALAADTSRLEHVLKLVTPRLVFAADRRRYGAAVAIAQAAGAMALYPGDGPDDLSGRERRARAVDTGSALAAIDHDTAYKVLMTSGSSALPKGVIQTHGMSCASLALEASLTTQPPGLRPAAVVIDGLPWSHVGGSITVLNNVLLAGASLHLDEGKPVPGRFAASLRNLAQFPQEHFATTPAGYAMLVEAMDRDSTFRQRFFSRLQTVKTGAAAMPEDIKKRFDAHARTATGHGFPFLIGYGSTEMHGVISLTREDDRPFAIGLPKPGVLVKLVPAGQVFEIRVKSPSLTPGYFGDAAATAAARDEEGFFRTGDGATFCSERGAEAILFAGRLGENFKLATGTWVAAADLRDKLLTALSGQIADCLVVGEAQTELGLLVWPIAGQQPSLEALGQSVRSYNAAAAGSSQKIRRAMVSCLPISPERFERTEKGSVNRSLVLAHRRDELQRLFGVEVSGDVLLIPATG